MITTSEFHGGLPTLHGPVGPRVQWVQLTWKGYHLISSVIWKTMHELTLIKCVQTKCTSHFLQSTCPVRLRRVLFSRRNAKKHDGCEMPSHLLLISIASYRKTLFTIAGASRCLWENRQHTVYTYNLCLASFHEPLKSQVKIHLILSWGSWSKRKVKHMIWRTFPFSLRIFFWLTVKKVFVTCAKTSEADISFPGSSLFLPLERSTEDPRNEITFCSWVIPF